jgi:hypothetical protein
MKKIFSVFAVLVLVSAVSFGALSTITSQDATKTGLEGFRAKVNANFAALPAVIVTNVSAQTAAVAGTVTLSYTTNIVTYLDASTNAVSWTNIAVTGVAVSVPGVATNVSVSTKAP